MVALPQDVVEAIEDSEERGEFEALPVGHVLARIKSNEEVPAKDADSFPMLKVCWTVLKPRALKGRTVWDRMSYSPKAAFRFRALFDAMDYDYDSDIDELQEDPEAEAVLYITNGLITSGKQKGKVGDEVDQILPADEENLSLVED